jgi:hypothetical protein
MNTVAALVRARRASFWIEVLAGRTPRAIRDVRVRGRRRSYLCYSIVSNLVLLIGWEGEGHSSWKGLLARRKHRASLEVNRFSVTGSTYVNAN